MTSKPRFTRRAVLAGSGAAVASPYIWTSAQAQAGSAIKIGIPAALTGPLGTVGQQTKRGAEFYAKVQNAKGGILGRKIELLIEDTAGNPANCVRKAQEMVERHGVKMFTGLTLSSEALAVVPKLAEWDAIFVSGINGDGRLTADSFVPNFFRANISGPMGARAVSLYLREAKVSGVYALGLDYAWGHNSVQVFEDEMKRANKNFIGKIFAPTGTKDYSTYITKIRQSGADACYLVLQGDDNNAFLSQSRQYGLPDKVTLLTEIVDLASIKAVGDASLGLVGSSRYSFSYDHPKNKEFVELWRKEHGGGLPDTFEGETWQAMQAIQAGIEAAKGTDTAPLRKALESVEIESIKGKIKFRECDHQAVQQGFMVKVVKKDGFDTPVPEVIATFPGERTTPGCKKTSYDN
ncbi:MAG: ABC transporter substrate-binding protein [Hyphomicrobiaceae bacterium]|jgi:branched-chain amino acid transport system substrate-binding protein